MGIKTIKDFQSTIRIDLKNNHEIYNKNIFWEYLKGNLNVYYKYKFIIYLRFFEFCTNNRGTFFGKIRYMFFKRRFKRLQMKTQLFISPNTCSEGLNIEHLGYIWIDSSTKLGKNNVLLPRVLFGKKMPGVTTNNDSIISTGDNVYVGTGATILGPVTIGSNVIIAAGSVVVNDIPDNCICGGVPAKIIKTINGNNIDVYFPYLRN